MSFFKHIIVLPRGGGGGGSDIPFTPAPSVGHEIGIMFGGIGAMLLGTDTVVPAMIPINSHD